MRGAAPARPRRFSIPRGNHAVVVTVQQLFKADAEGAPAAQPVSPGHWLVRGRALLLDSPRRRRTPLPFAPTAESAAPDPNPPRAIPRWRSP